MDLPVFIRKNRRRLVLKPNTLFGGEGVVLGRTVNQKAWERQLDQALRGGQDYVVQELAAIAMDDFPMLVQEKMSWQRRSTVSGFFFNSTGIGLVGRFSANPVVNVSQGGGLICGLWVH